MNEKFYLIKDEKGRYYNGVHPSDRDIDLCFSSVPDLRTAVTKGRMFYLENYCRNRGIKVTVEEI